MHHLLMIEYVRIVLPVIWREKCISCCTPSWNRVDRLVCLLMEAENLRLVRQQAGQPSVSPG